MRIATIESRHGIRDQRGVPHRIRVSEQWASLDDAVASTESRIRELGLTWQTRWLRPEIVEIDVHDPPIETLLAFVDAEAVEHKANVPIMDFLRFYIGKGGMMDALAEAMPGTPERLEALGVQKFEHNSPPNRWSSDFAEIEREIQARGVLEGVLGDTGGRGRRVQLWAAVLGFRGSLDAAMVWDGEDGPVSGARIGLGRPDGSVQQIPSGVVLISWRKLRELLDGGHECLVGSTL